MHRKPRLLIGGATADANSKARPVTVEELRAVMGRSGSKVDPIGFTVVGGQPGDTTTGHG
jgi:hypothetical protein